jgi:hypothetical protein
MKSWAFFAKFLAFGACATFLGCARSAPPSRLPSAAAALERMRKTTECSRALKVEGKLDYFGEAGRVRGNLLYMLGIPDRIRFDVFSPFGATLSTLTSDGKHFKLLDLRQKQFLEGPANACNLARFTQVPIPPPALVQLLRGEPPVLAHTPAAASIAWEGGRYVVRVQSRHDAREEIFLEPVDADWSRNWQDQRMRLLGVRVEQLGVELYNAELADHRPAKMSAPQVDPDGIDPPEPPSGPECRAEIPGRIRFQVAGGDQDVILENLDVSHNPPLAPRAFDQEIPRGVVVRYSACER